MASRMKDPVCGMPVQAGAGLKNKALSKQTTVGGRQAKLQNSLFCKLLISLGRLPN